MAQFPRRAELCEWEVFFVFSEGIYIPRRFPPTEKMIMDFSALFPLVIFCASLATTSSRCPAAASSNNVVRFLVIFARWLICKGVIPAVVRFRGVGCSRFFSLKESNEDTLSFPSGFVHGFLAPSSSVSKSFPSPWFFFILLRSVFSYCYSSFFPSYIESVKAVEFFQWSLRGSFKTAPHYQTLQAPDGPFSLRRNLTLFPSVRYFLHPFLFSVLFYLFPLNSLFPQAGFLPLTLWAGVIVLVLGLAAYKLLLDPKTFFPE